MRMPREKKTRIFQIIRELEERMEMWRCKRAMIQQDVIFDNVFMFFFRCFNVVYFLNEIISEIIPSYATVQHTDIISIYLVSENKRMFREYRTFLIFCKKKIIIQRLEIWIWKEIAKGQMIGKRDAVYFQDLENVKLADENSWIVYIPRDNFLYRFITYFRFCLYVDFCYCLYLEEGRGHCSFHFINSELKKYYRWHAEKYSFDIYAVWESEICKSMW